VSAGPDAETTRRVIERFGAARLLAFDRNPASRAPTVEVAHEALLRHWPRLRAWVDEAGRDLVLRAHLTAAAATWEASGRDDGDLYRGARLVDTEDWSNRADLTDSEHDFLSESLARRRAEEKAERARLDEQTRANRRLRRALAAVGAVLVVALVAGFLAIGQRNRARAETARAEESRANALAVTADEHVSSDRSLALLLAVEAALVDTSDRTTSVLLAAISGDNLPYTRTVIPTPAAAYSAMALTPDGAIAVAKRRDGLIDIVDITTRQVVVAGLFGPPSPVRGVDVSDDGRYAVVSGEDSDGTAAVVYSLPGGAEMARIASRIEGTIHQAVFAAGTNEVVVGDALGVLSIHDPLTGAAKGMIDTATGSEITALDVDGRTMFVADVPEIGFGLSSYVSAWDLDTGEPVVERREIDANFVVAILARDGLVYTAGAGAPVQLYDGATLDLIADDLDGPSQGGTAITSLDVAPDGSLAMGSEDGIEIRPPDDAPVEYVALPGGQAPGVAFTPDGGTLVSADSEGTISTWRLGVIEDLGVPLVPEGPGLVTVSPGGDRLAVWARGRGVQLFDLETLDHIGALESLGPDDSFLAFDFDSEGRTILTMTCPVEQEDHCDAVVALFDVGSMRRIAGPAPVGSLGADISQGAMLTADGSMVAVVSPGNTVRLLDVPSLEPVGDPLQLRDVSVGAGPEGLQVATGSRNGRSLVAAIGVFGQTVVWDITDDPAPLGTIAGVATALSFSPEGTLTVGYATGIVEVWDPIAMTRNGEPLSGPGITWRVDVAETGILLASSLEGSTRLWDLETRRALSGDLTSWGAALDLEGTRLFLGALGAPIGGVRVATLSLDVNDLLAEACRRAGRNLTVEEWTTYMPSDLEHRATCPEWPLQST
jgi:WD40 repeat protein